MIPVDDDIFSALNSTNKVRTDTLSFVAYYIWQCGHPTDLSLRFYLDSVAHYIDRKYDE